MSADLHIHIFEGISEDDLAEFCSSSLGSKYFNPYRHRKSYEEKYGPNGAYHRISETPNIWIGEVSWLKAAIFEDAETFVPDPVGKISELVGEDLPVIDEGFIIKVAEALGLNNETSYSISDKDKVIAFLREHMGKKVFTVSW